MKRLLLFVLVSVMLLSLLASCNAPQESGSETVSETESETEWAPAPNPASDFEYGLADRGEAIAVTKYVGTDTTVVIPSEIEGKPVTWIGIYFDPNNVIETLYLSDTVTRIDEKAFYQNTRLKEVHFGTGLQEIGEKAFLECASLSKITLPSSLKILQTSAFQSCTSLREVFIPKQVVLKGEGHFIGCVNLKTVVFEDGIEKISGWLSFGNSGIEHISIPSSVTELSCTAFGGCPYLKSVTFEGDAPMLLEGDFLTPANAETVTVYYSSGSKGWDDFTCHENYVLVSQ